MRTVVVGALLLGSQGSAMAAPDLAPGETALQARLIAPCCWNTTLDVHESEIATSLRAEIHARLTAGEAAAAIEDDLAGRYGEKIRAVPKGRDVRGDWSIAIGIAGLAIGLALVLMVRGWARRKPAPVVPAAPRDPAEEARLDDELDALER